MLSWSRLKKQSWNGEKKKGLETCETKVSLNQKTLPGLISWECVLLYKPDGLEWNVRIPVVVLFPGVILITNLNFNSIIAEAQPQHEHIALIGV